MNGTTRFGRLGTVCVVDVNSYERGIIRQAIAEALEQGRNKILMIRPVAWYDPDGEVLAAHEEARGQDATLKLFAREGRSPPLDLFLRDLTELEIFESEEDAIQSLSAD